jgi:hypothetical protein
MRQAKITKSSFVLASLCLTFALQSCSKLAQIMNYDLAMQSSSVTVSIPPESVKGITETFGTGTANYNVDSFIRASTLGTLGIANIASVKLLSCVLTLQNATPGNNFDNLASVSASFTTGDVAPYEIGITDNPAIYSTTLTIPVDSTAELKSYLTGSQFTYTLKGMLRKAVTDTMKCTIQFTYSIKVQG